MDTEQSDLWGATALARERDALRQRCERLEGALRSLIRRAQPQGVTMSGGGGFLLMASNLDSAREALAQPAHEPDTRGEPSCEKIVEWLNEHWPQYTAIARDALAKSANYAGAHMLRNFEETREQVNQIASSFASNSSFSADSCDSFIASNLSPD